MRTYCLPAINTQADLTWAVKQAPKFALYITCHAITNCKHTSHLVNAETMLTLIFYPFLNDLKPNPFRFVVTRSCMYHHNYFA